MHQLHTSSTSDRRDCLLTRGRVALSAIVAALLLGLILGFVALRSAGPSLAQQASEEEVIYLAYTVNNVGYIETCG